MTGKTAKALCLFMEVVEGPDRRIRDLHRKVVSGDFSAKEALAHSLMRAGRHDEAIPHLTDLHAKSFHERKRAFRSAVNLPEGSKERADAFENYSSISDSHRDLQDKLHSLSLSAKVSPARHIKKHDNETTADFLWRLADAHPHESVEGSPDARWAVITMNRYVTGHPSNEANRRHANAIADAWRRNVKGGDANVRHSSDPEAIPTSIHLSHSGS